VYPNGRYMQNYWKMSRGRNLLGEVAIS